MPTSAVIPSQPTHTSVLACFVSPDPALGELLVSIAHWYALDQALSEVNAELAALRAAPKWIAPSFEVVSDTLRKQPLTYPDHADCFAGKSVLELCWQMCERVQWLTRRIAILNEHGGQPEQLKENILEKRIAYPCFEARVAGIEAYQQALRRGLGINVAIFAGLTAESKKIGAYNPPRPSDLDYLAEDRPKAKRYATERANKWDTETRILIFGTNANCRQATWSIPRYFTRFIVRGNLYPAGPRYEPACLRRGVEPRTVTALELEEMRTAERKEWERREGLGLPSGLARPKTNFCFYRGAYVTQDHVCPLLERGEPCVDTERTNDYEAKLLRDVAAYRAKNRKEAEDGWEFQRSFVGSERFGSAQKYWQFCVAFEFPKVCDEEAMEKAAERLIKTVPREHLEALMASAAEEKLLPEDRILKEIVDDVTPSTAFCHHGKQRHYVLGKRRGPEFVRQQDLNLAMEL